MMGINLDLLQWFMFVLLKRLLVVVLKMKIFLVKITVPIIGKFNKRKVHSPFIDNIWGANLADMQLISKFNKGFRFYYVIDI